MTTTAPKYIDAKSLSRISRLEVRARLLVEGFLTGQHRSPYHGVAIEFAGHREYVAGDELKHIDWRVWSKTDRLYIKQYEEETNLGCQLLVDASRSMKYGDQSQPAWSKFDHAATAAAALAYLLNQQHDAVGLVTFDTKIGRQLPASAHPAQLRRLLHELEQVVPDDQTDVSSLFLDLATTINRRGIVAFFSDLFVDRDTLRECFRRFRGRKQEVIVLHVLHADELTFPFEDTTLFRDLEQSRELQTNPRSLRRAYLDVFQGYLAEVQKLCGAEGIDYVRLNTAEPLDAALAAYLSLRSRLRKRM
uniref:DUF58 domain-containing protein n=1 Tax=Schlesneria paludicola TaxID=360056 RepID=A0A7C2JWK8_9PLAN